MPSSIGGQPLSPRPTGSDGLPTRRTAASLKCGSGRSLAGGQERAKRAASLRRRGIDPDDFRMASYVPDDPIVGGDLAIQTHGCPAQWSTSRHPAHWWESSFRRFFHSSDPGRRMRASYPLKLSRSRRPSPDGYVPRASRYFWATATPTADHQKKAGVDIYDVSRPNLLLVEWVVRT